LKKNKDNPRSNILSKIIIGIHGLGNKPPKRILENWWNLSIREGLAAIGESWHTFRFELVYWADILHQKSLDPLVNYDKHPLYIENPYVPGSDFLNRDPDPKRKKILTYVEKQLDRLFLKNDLSFNLSKISDLLIKKYFKDFNSYYSATVLNRNKQKIPARRIINNRLIKVLMKHQSKQIMLIAHSMGSIIAYDVLTHGLADLKVDNFITIGSPLGFSLVMQKILLEQNKGSIKDTKAKTPDNIIRKWINYSDLEDKVAMNYDLADDFEANKRNILPEDIIVQNNYVYQENRNPHKSYGYLRTPQLAQAISEFLTYDRRVLLLWLEKKIHALKTTFFFR
jgi:hypothetical protein